MCVALAVMVACLAANVASVTDQEFQVILTTTIWYRIFVSYLIDIFPNWWNSMQIATLQMIGHAVLGTNFKTLQTVVRDLKHENDRKITTSQSLT